MNITPTAKSRMKYSLHWIAGAAVLFLLLPGVNAAEPTARPQTFCNPMDLAYRFQLSRLEVFHQRFPHFGKGLETAPAMVDGVTATRSVTDPRLATVSWNPVKNADFYIVRYGLAADRLFTNYQVYDGTTLNLNALNRDVSYVITVDAVNDSGVTRGHRTIPLP